MNERLNELRIQAGIGRLEDDPLLAVISKEGYVIDPLIGLEKFAELIIEECMEIVLSSDPSPKMTVREPYSTIMEKIKEHFGWHDD